MFRILNLVIFGSWLVYGTDEHRKDGLADKVNDDEFIDINIVYLPDPLVTFYPPRESTVRSMTHNWGYFFTSQILHFYNNFFTLKILHFFIPIF